jgi:flagellar motility protein MotE (MotC chaperone)
MTHNSLKTLTKAITRHLAVSMMTGRVDEASRERVGDAMRAALTERVKSLVADRKKTLDPLKDIKKRNVVTILQKMKPQFKVPSPWRVILDNFAKTKKDKQ